MKFVPLLVALNIMITTGLPSELHLPFTGRWFVAQGGDTLNVNNHMRVRAQSFGVDFAKVGGPSSRSLSKGRDSAVEDYFSWGEAVLAPSDGEIVGVVDGMADNPIGTKDPTNPGGNQVTIKISADRYVFIGHMQKGSIKVKVGETVKIGQQIGLCGNSGNTDFPHIHMHIQDSSVLNDGIGQNMIFADMHVWLTGKEFRHVDWPLTRGLFVEPE